MSDHVLTLSCAQAPGLVHAVSGFLVDSECDIVDSKQFDDRANGRFYLRIEFASPGAAATETLRQRFATVAEAHGMSWRMRPRDARTRVLAMVSRADHCLNDLLYRTRAGDLPVDLVAVVSNHLDHRDVVEWHGLPFVHIPVTRDAKPQAESALLRVVEEYDVELVVLARYMQVLSDELCTRLAGRVINIHHSFLPSFKGAKPYHQAYERGVKVVGATAHYVTPDLDEGPIITQEVIPVDHSYAPDDLVAVGRDAEVAALGKAVRWHCEGRVFVDGRRTVVLR